MKFRIAVISSLIFHFSLFAIAFFFPGIEKQSGTTYYIDLINLRGGDGSPPGKNRLIESKTKADIVENRQKVKNLTVKKKSAKSKLRFPDKKGKKKIEKKREESLISVVRKKKKPKKTDQIKNNKKEDNGILRTGLSGDGPGTGSGGLPGNFPYGYYIDTLRSRIASSWYNPLASSGVNGSFNVVVYFRIYRNGSVGDLKVVKRSGKELFDMSAIRVIREVTPFPPLPSDYTEFYLGVYFEFEWKK